MKAKFFGKAYTLKNTMRIEADPLALEPTIREIGFRKPLRVMPNGLKVWGYNQQGRQICGARKVNQPGYYCKRKEVYHPSGRCKWHGGPSLAGAEHGRFRHGRYVGLPGSSKQVMEESLSDPNQLSLRPDIAAIDARIAEISEKMGGIEPDILKRILLSAEHIRFLMAEDYEEKDLLREFNSLLDMIFGLHTREQNWSQVVRLQKHRAMLSKIEDERQRNEQTQIPVEKVTALFIRFGEICRDHLLAEYPSAFEAIDRELQPILLDFFPRNLSIHGHADSIKATLGEIAPEPEDEILEGEIVETALVPVASAP